MVSIDTTPTHVTPDIRIHEVSAVDRRAESCKITGLQLELITEIREEREWRERDEKQCKRFIAGAGCGRNSCGERPSK